MKSKWDMSIEELEELRETNMKGAFVLAGVVLATILIWVAIELWVI